jgi:thiamine pyrophosphokinase
LRALVFANGCLRISRAISQHIALHPEDIVIAADGGAHHCLTLGIRPRFVIGDLDSLGKEDLSQLRAQGSEIIQHPRRKDYTDLELSLRYAQKLGVAEILILGALGERWDQTIANILLPAVLSPCADHTTTERPPRITILDGNQELFFLRGGDQLEIRGQPGDVVSLIPVADHAHGVTTQNLEYPLDADNLLFGSTLGISNILLGEHGSVSFIKGLMLCVVIHQDSPQTVEE